MGVIGEIIRAERERRGWTQAQLADMLNVKIGTLSGYERGYRQPDIDMLNMIASVFNTSTDYLLGRTTIREAIPPTSPSQGHLFPAELKACESPARYFVTPRESVLAQLTDQERETYLDMCQSKTSPFRGRHDVGPNGMDDDMIVALVRVFEYVKDYDDKTGRVPRKRKPKEGEQTDN